jgi:hypothetical protein
VGATSEFMAANFSYGRTFGENLISFAVLPFASNNPVLVPVSVNFDTLHRIYLKISYLYDLAKHFRGACRYSLVMGVSASSSH